MNAIGLSLIMKMGCICTRETLRINGNKFLVIERIGDGGFSTVDLVENVSNKKRFALKRATCHSLEDQNRILKEIDYLKKLRHPNIMEIIDSTVKGSADIVVNATSEAFMVLPYYPRGTLHDALAVRELKRDYMSVSDALRIFTSICEGVRFMHELKPEPLAHRDLKSANICFTDTHTPVIIDLGSAAPARVQICGSHDAQKLQDSAAELCSVPYRAPELFHVESYCVIDERTDVWSLGCLLYAICYFLSPFDLVYLRGDSVALAVLSGGIHFPDNTPFPDDIHDLIMFMLNTNASERPFIQNVIEKTHFIANKLGNIA